jgi:hypothetical protein
MRLAALLASIALAGAASADEGSTTPYATLYQVLSPVQTIGKYDRLVAIERIESKLSDVQPSSIRVTIHAKSGAIAVPIAADGLVKFPATDALRSENPPVETNQPKGSLAFIVNVALKLADPARVPWSDIEAGLEQVRAFYTESRGASAPGISGIEIHFAPGAPAMLTIEGRSERLLMADPNGRVIVTRDMAPAAEKPVLAFSRAPDFVLPYADEKK